MSGDPVDQACGIQQRGCLIEELLDVESDFKPLLMRARTGAGIGCAPYSSGLIKAVTVGLSGRGAGEQLASRNLLSRSELHLKSYGAAQ